MAGVKRFSIFLGSVALIYTVGLLVYTKHELQFYSLWAKICPEIRDAYTCLVHKSDLNSMQKADPSIIQKADLNIIYQQALAQRADENKTVIICSVDHSYITMALNVHASLEKLALQNVLFVCMDGQAVEAFKRRAIFCYHDRVTEKDAEAVSYFGTEGFKRKTGRKLYIVAEALDLGFTVLLMDADIALLRNPLPFMNCEECDLHYQQEYGTSLPTGIWRLFNKKSIPVNGGFMFFRATPSSKALHKRVLDIFETNKLTMQKCINAVLPEMVKNKKIKIKELPLELFPNGAYYYAHTARMFPSDSPCPDCVLVHSNFMYGMAGKRYRFKEMLQWHVDEDNQEKKGYYSNPSARYLTYDNPARPQGDANEQRDALENAFAMSSLLNRTLILPSFTCRGCSHPSCKVGPFGRCTLQAHVDIARLDEQFSYREHVFLQHPAVPQQVKSSRSQTFIIVSGNTNINAAKTFNSEYILRDPGSADVISRLASDEHSVLMLDSVPSKMLRLRQTIDKKLDARLHEGIRRCSYWQDC